MPDTITFSQDLGNASFGIDPASLQQEEEVQEAEPVTEETLEGDIVEITLTEEASESATEESAPVIYNPETFSDDFNSAIENGILNPANHFNPLQIRFQSGAVETYEARQGLGNQVMQSLGQGSPYAALFNMQYQDANPDPTGASSNVDGKVEQQRIADQNLALLNTL